MTQLPLDMLLKEGLAVTPGGIERVDIGVYGGKITFIGVADGATKAKTVINCKGLHILPGILDTQVHFREPGLTYKEDLHTGSKAAVLGGVTAVFEMPNTIPPTTDRTALAGKLEAAQRMYCEHAFFLGATPDNAQELARIENMPGCCGIKIFMGSSTGSLLVDRDKDLAKILAHGQRVVSIHAEDEQLLQQSARLKISGDWRSHEISRPPEAAYAASKRIIELARRHGRHVHILHISTKEECGLLACSKDTVSAEVTPQHLSFYAPDCYEKLQGMAQMNPPLRTQEHQQALWKALRCGIFDVIGSDHAPHSIKEKEKPYPGSPSGMPGVQTLLPVMLTHVAHKRLSLLRLVDLLCAGPQRIFGITGKGRLALGYDADFTLVDLEKKETITHAQQASKCGWTPFDGFTAHGWPVATIIRGRCVMREGEISGEPGGKPVAFAATRKKPASHA